MIRAITAASMMIAVTAASALSAAVPILQPVPFGNAILRYHQGRPSVAIHGQHGLVEITPLPMDHGSTNFGVTVYNDSNRPADIDLSDVTIFVGDAPAEVLTIAELQKREKNRAFWTSMAVAAVSGLAAGVVAASNSHTTIRTSSAYGTHVTRITYHNGYNAANAALIGAGGAAVAGSIQEEGRRAAVQIGDEILGLTTVDPGDAYGGRVVIDKIKVALPQPITISVRWNGETYASKWQLVADGTPAPLFNEERIVRPAADTLRPAALQPAVMVQEPKAPVAASPIQPIADVRSKHYPHDDTVQVPM